MTLLAVHTAPAALVTLAEAKAQARVDDEDFDAQLTLMCNAASRVLDGPYSMTGRCFAAQTWNCTLAGLPTAAIIPVPGASEVAAVTYYDADNVSQTLDVGDYYRVTAIDRGLLLESDVSLPATYARADAVTFQVSNDDNIPDDIKHAALLLISAWFDDRSVGDIPPGVEALVGLHKVGWVGS